MDSEKAIEVRAWLTKATDDLRAAELDLSVSPPLLTDAVFHCQQAAEKAMKGFLTAHDTIFRKTHDLDEIGDACEEIDATLADALDPARDLTVFAWQFRYPGETDSPPLEEVRASIIVGM